jgi:hypothetical protein
MGRIVIAAYRPRPGRQADLERLVREHYQRLAAERLVTERGPLLMRARDGTVIEVFEWISAETIAAAHENQAVQSMWGEFDRVSEHVPLSDLAEASGLFAEFEPLAADEALHPEFSP